jgi:1-acyl-sn-glycerol-3-phosphate acyltransferase
MTLFSCLWSIATHPGLLAQLTPLPIITTGNSDRRHLAAHAHRAIAHHLKHQAEPSARHINPNPSA